MKTFQCKCTILSFKIYFMYSTKNLQFKVFIGMAWHYQCNFDQVSCCAECQLILFNTNTVSGVGVRILTVDCIRMFSWLSSSCLVCISYFSSHWVGWRGVLFPEFELETCDFNLFIMGNTDTKLNFRKAVVQLTSKTQVSRHSNECCLA